MFWLPRDNRMAAAQPRHTPRGRHLMVPVSDERNNRDLSFFLMTRNSGATWTRSENIPNQQSQGEQPAVAQRRDDSLLAFARTSSRPLEQRGTSGEDVLRRAECWRICEGCGSRIYAFRASAPASRSRVATLPAAPPRAWSHQPQQHKTPHFASRTSSNPQRKVPRGNLLHVTNPLHN